MSDKPKTDRPDGRRWAAAWAIAILLGCSNGVGCSNGAPNPDSDSHSAHPAQDSKTEIRNKDADGLANVRLEVRKRLRSGMSESEVKNALKGYAALAGGSWSTSSAESIYTVGDKATLVVEFERVPPKPYQMRVKKWSVTKPDDDSPADTPAPK